MASLVEFDRDTLLWLDRYQADIDAYVDTLGSNVPKDYDLRWALRHWMQFGFIVLPQAIDHALIDSYLADLAELIETRDRYHLRVLAEGLGVKPICEVPESAFNNPHFRLMDFHNASTAGKRLALHPAVTTFLHHVMRETVVAMQTLTFIYGSEQRTHQDFPYVVSGVTSHLAASWIALEDVHPDAGPLGYYPGSHTIRKFDWEDGLVWKSDVRRNERHFQVHLEEECEGAGLDLKTFPARKGDVFIWHAALAHRGMAVNQAGLTRRSVVTHFSSRRAYAHDRRAPGQPPVAFELNGALVYGDPTLTAEENIFQRGGPPPAIRR
jgi:phytanoyl-CoA hydroxylase